MNNQDIVLVAQASGSIDANSADLTIDKMTYENFLKYKEILKREEEAIGGSILLSIYEDIERIKNQTPEGTPTSIMQIESWYGTYVEHKFLEPMPI